MKDLHKIRQQLLDELLEVAVKPLCLNREEKLHELHKRINAIDRYVAETPKKPYM